MGEASESDRGPERVSAGWTAGLKQYAIQNPIATLSALVLTFGGVQLLIFFGYIGYLPDLDLASVGSVLYAVALLGLCLLAYLLLLLILPGLVLRSLTAKKAAQSPPKTPQPLRYRWPMLIATAFWTVVAVVWMFGDELRELAWTDVLCGLLGLLVLGSLWAYGMLLWSKFTPQREAILTKGAESGWLAKLESCRITLIAGAFLALPGAFVLLVGSQGGAAKKWPWLFLAFCCAHLFFVAVLSAFLAEEDEKRVARTGAVFGAVLLVMLLVGAQALHVVPMGVVRMLKLGDVDHARLAVSASACQQISRALGFVVCEDDVEDKELPRTVCPVRIVSRIGGQFVLEFATMRAHKNNMSLVWGIPYAPDAEVLWRRVILDKSLVLAWQPLPSTVIKTKIPEKKPVGRNEPGPVATWVNAGGSEADPHDLAIRDELCPTIQPGQTLPAVASPASTSIRIDAQGSQSQQTVVNLHMSNTAAQSVETKANSLATTSTKASPHRARKPAPPCQLAVLPAHAAPTDPAASAPSCGTPVDAPTQP